MVDLPPIPYHARVIDPARARQEIGARIQGLRREAGLTQTQLADRAGISNEFMSRIEHGTGTPSLDTLLRIAEALALNACALLPQPDADGPPGLDKLVRIARRLDERELELLVRLAEQLRRWGAEEG